MPTLDNSVIMENKLDLICMSSSSGIRNHFWFRPKKKEIITFALPLLQMKLRSAELFLAVIKASHF